MSETLLDHLRQQGATLGSVESFQTALDFGDLAAECRAIERAAGLVDLSARTQIELHGADRASFLHNLSTNEIRKLPVGAGCEAFLCNAQGHTLAHGLVFNHPDYLVFDTVPAQGSALVAHLDRYLIREQVELHDRSAERGELLLAGPQAESLLQQLGLADLPTARLGCTLTQLAGTPVSIRRVVDFAGPLGFLLDAARSDLVALWQSLQASGAVPCGYRAYDTARIESGFPLFGIDLNERNLPQELDRDSLAISFVKGCYIGQETVARIDALGHVNKTLVGVRFAPGEVPPRDLPLRLDDKEVGKVTSAAYSQRLAAPLALAYVRRGPNAPGTQLQSAQGPAEVVPLPCH